MPATGRTSGTPASISASELPHTVAIIIGSKLAPRLMGWIDARLIAAAGGAVAVAGTVWQSRITADGTFLGNILGPGALTMLGAGLLLTPVSAVAMSGVGRGDQGLVSGLLNTARQLGGALGLTILATAAASRIASRAAGGANPAQALSDGYGLAFLIGAEDEGLPEEWRTLADVQVEIPMHARTADSLNASAAAAVLLFEAVRQRA